MKKFMILALLFSLNSFAGNEDRLRDLIKKDVASKIAGGKGLNDSDKKEYNRLSEEVGLIKSSQMTNEVMSGVSQSKPSSFQSGAPSKSIPEILISSPTFGGLPQRMNATITKPTDSAALKDKQKKDAAPSESKNEMPPITVVINQGPSQNPMQPEDQKKTDALAAAKIEEKSSQLFPQISKETEKELMKNYKAVAEKSANEPEQVAMTGRKSIETPAGEQIYTPSPIGTGINSPGFTVDRDSMAILHKPVSVNDSINIDMCIAYGAAINFEESIKTTIGRVQSTDDKYFRFQETPNKRGVYVSLIKPVPKDGIWLSSLMLYRKDNDLIYLINLRGRPCPEGVINFPKVVYLSEKKDRSSRLDEKYKMADMEVLTPEDTIISVSRFKYRFFPSQLCTPVGIHRLSRGVDCVWSICLSIKYIVRRDVN